MLGVVVDDELNFKAHALKKLNESPLLEVWWPDPHVSHCRQKSKKTANLPFVKKVQVSANWPLASAPPPSLYENLILYWKNKMLNLTYIDRWHRIYYSSMQLATLCLRILLWRILAPSWIRYNKFYCLVFFLFLERPLFTYLVWVD